MKNEKQRQENEKEVTIPATPCLAFDGARSKRQMHHTGQTCMKTRHSGREGSYEKRKKKRQVKEQLGIPSFMTYKAKRGFKRLGGAFRRERGLSRDAGSIRDSVNKTIFSFQEMKEKNTK